MVSQNLRKRCWRLAPDQRLATADQPESVSKTGTGFFVNMLPLPNGLSLDSLKRILRGRAGESKAVKETARTLLQRYEHGQAATARAPLWALSPYERQLHRGKGVTLKQSGSYFALP